MLYILEDDKRRANCIQCIGNLNLDKKWQVEIKPYKRQRSEAQNRTMWSFLNVIADHTGHNKDELHEIFKARFLGMRTIKALGDLIVMPRSTTTLSTKEFADYLRCIEDVAVTMGIRLPYPDDYQFLTEVSAKTKPAQSCP